MKTQEFGKLIKKYSKRGYPFNNRMFSVVIETYEVYENAIVRKIHRVSQWNSSYDEEEIEIIPAE